MKKSTIYKITGGLSLLGCLSVIITDIIGIMVHEAHDPISDTISMLAIGKYGWIQDLGIDLFAMSFLALAVGLYFYKRTGTAWLISLLILILLSADLILIAEHNQYAGDKENTLHQKLVYIMAGLFLLLTLLSRSGLAKLKPYLTRFILWVAGLWLVFAAAFPFMPDGIDGAYERLVCVLLVLWPAVVSIELINARSE
ncbi:DUF998 domain-containing protein [Zeaxanthinibacter enoshimensis]|uniref:Uncharacterized protein DUF998 n=1 Tax=Zeaxanthinibacter enoshimensis TaxID=392009 RepID=A0A4R6TPM4_9FLAO|nr:DUF998 domain-containing protein [Zeaxanthinibacter enoshimensis]TDQ32217.1 uncharacterized protein DUF998 [Zeaxanthinibacter enoshimensis]